MGNAARLARPVAGRLHRLLYLGSWFPDNALDASLNNGDETIAAPSPRNAGAIMMTREGGFCRQSIRSPVRNPVSDKMSLVNRLTTLSLLLAAGLLAGCNTTSRGTRGLLSSKPSASAAYITALQGGIVSRTGVDLSGSDRSRALEAEYRALEGAAGGQAISWVGGGANGEVVANAPYQVGTQNCRQYRHTLTAKGKDTVARGAACRNADGTWTPLT
jgi:surface antigen